MSDRPNRLDESLTAEVFRKSVHGSTDIKPDLSRLRISPSGHVQPAEDGATATGETPKVSEASRKDD